EKRDLDKTPSCPRLSRASTPLQCRSKKDVNGRDKPGHDGETEPINHGRNFMKLSLENKVVMITGPAKGMGAAITHAFAAEGCKLALLGRDTAAIAPVADEVTRAGRE